MYVNYIQVFYALQKPRDWYCLGECYAFIVGIVLNTYHSAIKRSSLYYNIAVAERQRNHIKLSQGDIHVSSAMCRSFKGDTK